MPLPVQPPYMLAQPSIWWRILDFSIIEFANLLVVAVTGYWVYRYTRETQALREDNQKLLKLNYQTRIEEMKPVVVFANYGVDDSVTLKNIGKGPALDIELRISQIHTTGGLTNLRNCLGSEAQRHLFNLGVNDSKRLNPDTTLQYTLAKGSEFSYGIKDAFVLLATYQDIERRPYYTMTAIRIAWDGNNPVGVMKRTKFADYTSGETEKLVTTDWIA